MGRDKATLPFGTGSMLTQIVDRLATVCGGGLWLVAAAQADVTPPRGAVLLRDRQPDRGPLEGLTVALQATRSLPATVIVGCDAPFLHPPLLRALADRLLAAAADAVVIRDVRCPHPLMGVYRPRVEAVAQALIDEGHFSLQRLLDRLRVDFVTEEFVRCFDPHLRSLINVNTPADYQAAVRMANLADQARERPP
jgi:molybdopterin-guanine dinucleotide biosynthesis protein A